MAKVYDHRNPDYRAMVLRHLKESEGKVCTFYFYEGAQMAKSKRTGNYLKHDALLKSVTDKEAIIEFKHRTASYPIRKFLSKWKNCFGINFK